jgi:hypothetical protein
LLRPSIGFCVLAWSAGFVVACHQIGADGFQASIDRQCPPGFLLANDRCYRMPPIDGLVASDTDAGAGADRGVTADAEVVRDGSHQPDLSAQSDRPGQPDLSAQSDRPLQPDVSTPPDRPGPDLPVRLDLGGSPVSAPDAAALACPRPNPANRVVNGGFDRDVSGWTQELPTPDTQLAFAVEDASACPSGSMVQTFANPMASYIMAAGRCVGSVAAATTYNYGGSLRRLGNVRTRCLIVVSWYRGANCSNVPGQEPIYDDSVQIDDGPLGVWQLAQDGRTPPPGAVSAAVRVMTWALESSSTSARCAFDMLFMTPAPGGW